MANPFMIQPGGDYTKGLKGLSDVVGQIEERKREEVAQQKATEKFATIKQGALDAYRSGDPDAMAEFSLANPEFSQAMSQASGFRNKQTSDNYKDSLFSFYQNPTEENANELIQDRQKLLQSQGVGPEGSQETDSFIQRFQQDPEGTKKAAAEELAFRYPKEWKAMRDATEVDEVDKYEGLTAGYEEYLRVNDLEKSPENYAQYKFKEESSKEFSPSPLKKLINERQGYIDDGLDPSDPIVKAYDAKISGTDIDLEEMTQEEIDTWGAFMAVGGKLPSLGRGKQATKIRGKIAKSAAQYALGAKEDGITDDPKKTPAEAALSMLGEQADTKSIQGAQNFLDKQLSSMGSFVTNLNSQVDKVAELSKDLKTFDTRLLNIPLRTLRGRIKGSPLQAKYDMYLSEIESEIGKLATGSTGSVAELSASAQEKWSKIHDKNLSVSDMLDLLSETKEAANFRQRSVQLELDKARSRMRREKVVTTEGKPSAEKTDEELMKSLGL